MIFFTDNCGNIIKSLPSPVYQGSANTNTIYLIAPFAVNSQVAVAFKLPNGAVVPPVAMSQQSALQGIKDEAGRTYAGWTYAIPNAVTRYYGVVSAQFFFYAAESGVITATASVRFVVNAGVPAALPDTPDEDVYESILGNIASLQERLNSGYYVARAVFPWNEGATYGTNEITFYPGYGEYGAFVMSLQEGNTGNLPYSADGKVNSVWWKLIADFNALADLAEAVDTLDEYVEQAKQAAEDAQESADAAATSAASAASSARMAGLAADDAQQSASESAQSALESKAYMEQAREYAQKEYQLYDSYADLPRPGDPAFIYLVPNVQSLEYVQKVAAQLAADGVDVSAATERELYAAALAQPIADERNDSYIEYLWVTNINDYERIGSVNDIDLSEYAKIYGTYPDMTVGKANQLVNARKISVDLASSSPASFDGTKDVAAGVTGILPVENGGTGADDLMDIKVGDSAHADMADTANDPNAVHFTEQTLTDEQKLQARKNISAAAEEQALKNMYNLGAFDTFVDNGNGTATITRKTGYVRIDGSQNWARWSGDGNYFYTKTPQAAYLDNNSGMCVGSNPELSFSGAWNAENCFWVYSHGNSGWGSFFANNIDGVNSPETCKAYFAQHPTYVQYELATSYTEEVILDQPIHTLDVNGEQFVRDEWEKALNLANPWSAKRIGDLYTISEDGAFLGIASLDNRPWNYNNADIYMVLDPGTYTASVTFSGTLSQNSGSNIFAEDGTQFEQSFTLSQETSIGIMLKIYDGGIAKVMLNEGSNAYPYQPYNGAIVHEKELENYLPRSGGTVDGNLNVTEQLQENGQRVYSPNNKPSASDVGALPNTGGTVNGNTTVNGTFTVANHNMTVGGTIFATGDLDVNNAHVSGNAYADNVYVKQNNKSVAVYSPINPPPGASISVTENSDGTVNLVI